MRRIETVYIDASRREAPLVDSSGVPVGTSDRYPYLALGERILVRLKIYSSGIIAYTGIPTTGIQFFAAGGTSWDSTIGPFCVSVHDSFNEAGTWIDNANPDNTNGEITFYLSAKESPYMDVFRTQLNSASSALGWMEVQVWGDSSCMWHYFRFPWVFKNILYRGNLT